MDHGGVAGGIGSCSDRASASLPNCGGSENGCVLCQWGHDDSRRGAIECRQARVGILEPAAGHVAGRTGELPRVFLEL